MACDERVEVFESEEHFLVVLVELVDGVILPGEFDGLGRVHPNHALQLLSQTAQLLLTLTQKRQQLTILRLHTHPTRLNLPQHLLLKLLSLIPQPLLQLLLHLHLTPLNMYLAPQ